MLSLIEQVLFRGDAYEEEYKAKVADKYKELGIPVSGLEEVFAATGDTNWEYTFRAKRRGVK